MIELTAFSSTQRLPRIEGQVKLGAHRIEFFFEINDIEKEITPQLAPSHFTPSTLKRADGLWQNTCFEAFWSEPHLKSYWEFNLSPQGLWNCYSFEDYRRPQPPTPSSEFTLIDVKTTASTIACQIESKDVYKKLNFSLCAVIKTKSGQTHYYSTKHTNSKPDFHHRDSLFIQRGSI